jgi:hypothetical protein
MNTPPKRQQQQHNTMDADLDARTPLRRYFSRKSKSTIRFHDLPVEPGYIGHYSAWGFVYFLIFLTVPVAYVYIGFILLRELCMAFPHSFYAGMQHYIPQLAWIVSKMEKSSLIVEAWCVIEGIFYIMMKLHIKWLQMKDPLEASLSAAPMMDLKDRGLLWSRMMGTTSAETNLVDFISGWFFDSALENISRYDVRDFLCWSMFEGRNQEHLTGDELRQLEGFLEDLEVRLSYHLFGEATEEEESALEEDEPDKENGDLNRNSVSKRLFDKTGERRPRQGESRPLQYPRSFAHTIFC